MIVFLMCMNSSFTMVRPKNELSWVYKGGVSPATPWSELEFVPATLDDEFMFVDCLAMNTSSDGFLISEYALSHLKLLLEPSVHFWPVRVLGQPYWWLNCMTQIKALDQVNTDADWSEINGKWGSIRWISATRRIVFEVESLRDAPQIFRLPEYPQGLLFARDKLNQVVQDKNLTGFKFELVWCARTGGVFDPPGVGLGGLFDGKSSQARETERRRTREILIDR